MITTFYGTDPSKLSGYQRTDIQNFLEEMRIPRDMINVMFEQMSRLHGQFIFIQQDDRIMAFAIANPIKNDIVCNPVFFRKGFHITLMNALLDRFPKFLIYSHDSMTNRLFDSLNCIFQKSEGAFGDLYLTSDRFTEYFRNQYIMNKSSCVEML